MGARCAGILHTIFFHRFFPSVLPQTRDVLDLTLPYIDDVELETMIDQRAATLERQLDAERSQSHGGSGNGGGRGQITVLFYEKRRRKNWFPMRGDEEVCWESWTLKVTVAEPRTESGEISRRSPLPTFPYLPIYQTVPVLPVDSSRRRAHARTEGGG